MSTIVQITLIICTTLVVLCWMAGGGGHDE
jgi:hypothetical protein